MTTELIRKIEELAANAWPAEIVQHLGGWRFRFTGGSSRRVNSVWPNRAPIGNEIEEALDMVEDFYQVRGVIPRYKICPAALPENLPAILSNRGYIPDAHTATKIAPIEEVLENTIQLESKITYSNHLTEEWFQTYVGASGYSQASLPIRRGILTRIGPPAGFITLSEHDTPVVVGLGVVERGWMGIFCLVTVPVLRRRGFATAITHVLANWGKSRGAEHIYLQVMEDNPAALRLYQGMGFTRLYQYSYYELVPAE